MVQIRCPSCDTLHALEAGLFAHGPRKVRCASCRTVWEASNPEADLGETASLAEAFANPLQATTAAQMDSAEDDLVAQTPAFAQEPDDLTHSPFATAPAMAFEAAGEDTATTIESAPEPMAMPEPKPRRRTQGGKAARKAGQAARRPRLALVAAAGFATFASIMLFRHDIVRNLPDTAPVFEKLGLDINLYGLDITDVGSRITRDESGETLEIRGMLVNITKRAQKIPPLRLSIRGRDGQELYVWTASAEQAELAPGESLNFRRRLASPPSDAYSVMVRFVAKDDIVASIR